MCGGGRVHHDEGHMKQTSIQTNTCTTYHPHLSTLAPLADPGQRQSQWQSNHSHHGPGWSLHQSTHPGPKTQSLWGELLGHFCCGSMLPRRGGWRGVLEGSCVYDTVAWECVVGVRCVYVR